MESKTKCKGVTQRGTPCQRYALVGSFYCKTHQNEQDISESEKHCPYCGAMVAIGQANCHQCFSALYERPPPKQVEVKPLPVTPKHAKARKIWKKVAENVGDYLLSDGKKAIVTLVCLGLLIWGNVYTYQITDKYNTEQQNAFNIYKATNRINLAQNYTLLLSTANETLIALQAIDTSNFILSAYSPTIDKAIDAAEEIVIFLLYFHTENASAAEQYYFQAYLEKNMDTLDSASENAGDILMTIMVIILLDLFAFLGIYVLRELCV